MQNSTLLVHESDVFASQWLSNYGNINYVPTYADTVSLSHVLVSYSTINNGMIFILTNTTEILRNPGLISHIIPPIANTSYIYLRQFNVMKQLIQWDPRANITFTFNELPILNSTEAFISRIYSNGASEIEFRTP